MTDREVEDYRLSREACECVEPQRAAAVIGTALLGHGDYSGVGGKDYAPLDDGAGFADPSTDEGIENALRSATLLAKAYADDGDFPSYPRGRRALFETEFRVSRLVRRVLVERRLGRALVRRAMTAEWAHALPGAAANTTNEHDPNLLRLLTRRFQGVRRIRRDPDAALRGGRSPVPCGCWENRTAAEICSG